VGSPAARDRMAMRALRASALSALGLLSCWAAISFGRRRCWPQQPRGIEAMALVRGRENDENHAPVGAAVDSVSELSSVDD